MKTTFGSRGGSTTTGEAPATTPKKTFGQRAEKSEDTSPPAETAAVESKSADTPAPKPNLKFGPKPTPPAEKPKEEAKPEEKPVEKPAEEVQGAAEPASGTAEELNTEDSPAETAALHTRAPMALSTEVNNGVEGELDSSDLKFPSLKVVIPPGPLSQTFEAGAFILSGELPLSDPNGSIEVTFLRIKKEYEENIEWGSDERARIWQTEAAVRADGLWLEWNNDEKPPVSPVARALVVIKNPGLDDAPEFMHEFEGETYAIALMNMKGTMYTKLAKPIFTAAQFNLRNGIHFGSWKLTSKEVKAGKRDVWTAIPSRLPNHSPEKAAFLLSLSEL